MITLDDIYRIPVLRQWIRLNIWIGIFEGKNPAFHQSLNIGFETKVVLDVMAGCPLMIGIELV